MLLRVWTCPEMDESIQRVMEQYTWRRGMWVICRDNSSSNRVPTRSTSWDGSRQGNNTPKDNNVRCSGVFRGETMREAGLLWPWVIHTGASYVGDFHLLSRWKIKNMHWKMKMNMDGQIYACRVWQFSDSLMLPAETSKQLHTHARTHIHTHRTT